MVEEKNRKAEKKEAPDTAAIRSAFLAYIEKKEKRPVSLNSFCREYDFDMKTVKAHYKTLAALEKDVWLKWFDETITVLAGSEEYKNYSAQERLLAFYYTWLETIKPYRKYVKAAPVVPKLYSVVDWFLEDMKQAFLQYANEIVQLAVTNEEIVKRPVLQNIYDKALWHQFLFVMNFRIKDKSEKFTKTDEAVERAVMLSFELAGRTQLDAIIDFGKFLWKSNEGRTKKDSDR